MSTDIRRYMNIFNEGAVNLSQQLIQRFGGKVMPFSQLPPLAKKAIQRRARENMDPGDRLVISPNHMFGYVEIPIEALKDAVLAQVRDEGGEFDSFDAYHKWYVGHGDTPTHTEVWPIIMYPSDNEVLHDGSHRFHSYVRSGVKVVPAVWDVSSHDK